MSEQSQQGQTGVGRRRWAVAEGYIPAWSHGPEPEMVSHESVCLLNAGAADAHESWQDVPGRLEHVSGKVRLRPRPARANQ